VGESDEIVEVGVIGVRGSTDSEDEPSLINEGTGEGGDDTG
jgi:hypothetical protein